MPKLLLLSAGAALLAYQVVRTSSVDAFVRRNPAAAAAITPSHPRVVLALADLEFKLNDGAISPVTAAAVRAALAEAPLAEEPFLLSGLAALVREDEAEAERLLAEAVRRNPRERTARLILLDRYLRTDRVREAATEITVLNRLIPEARGPLVQELVRFADEPGTATALAAALRTDPETQAAVLLQLAKSGASPEVVLRLAQASAPERGPVRSSEWQGALVSSLVDKGEIGRAHALWAGFAGLPAPGGAKAIYDGRFEGKPGSPPFNWELNSLPAGVAERARTPGLQVEYYGRERAELASQLLMLAPGRYRLSLRAEGDASGEDSRLEWQVFCGPAKAPIATVPITKITYAPRVVAGAFSVPAGCGAQWLRLVGVPAEFPSGQSVTITDLQVRQ